MNNLNVKMQGKNQFIDDIWAHLKAFKLKLNLFAGQLDKNDLSHFSRLNSIPSANEEKLKNYEDGLKKLHFEFERRFQDFSAIQTELDIFTMPFNVNCEAVRSDLQLELIELQSNNHLKQSFLNMPKLEFYKSLSKRLNTLTFPIESDMAESVKSVINERRMHLIQDSLKMSLQRLQSAALRNTRPNSNVKVKKKSRGYFIPQDLERQRTAARRAYLASLEKTAVQPKVLPHSARGKTDAKKDGLKPKSLKTTTKSNLRKFNKRDKKEEEPTLVESDKLAETKDENIETAIDAIMDDILGETVLVINKIKQSKSEKSSSVIQNQEVPDNVSTKNLSMDLDSKETEAAMIEQFQNKLTIIKQNLHCVRKGTESNGGKLEPVEIKSLTTVTKNATESEQFIYPTASNSVHLKGVPEIKNTLPPRDIGIDPVKARQIFKCRKEYWSYLERISRSKKGNFDPWALSNMVAESLLDDCIQEIAEELQDVPASLIADLYDQEFFESI
ncbi:hypothetical protein AVEN_212637-2 [Araneus ventricosus]|uniref:General transcription factor II-I repeat domain-containing protein 2 n=1 Tax=Araneus ventricosus TaxID=182803 RepID=A0A4Y2P2D9_ARAVE|nr:hypothetical protein AVEN_212637-2 [Araneus ventricosus]